MSKNSQGTEILYAFSVSFTDLNNDEPPWSITKYFSKRKEILRECCAGFKR
jgi:hypothetical protein